MFTVVTTNIMSQQQTSKKLLKEVWPIFFCQPKLRSLFVSFHFFHFFRAVNYTGMNRITVKDAIFWLRFSWGFDCFANSFNSDRSYQLLSYSSIMLSFAIISLSNRDRVCRRGAPRGVTGLLMLFIANMMSAPSPCRDWHNNLYFLCVLCLISVARFMV